MTYLTESRDALAKALYVYAHREGRAERVRAWESDTIPRLMKDQRREWADALIASGAVIDASTLADDEALRFTEQDIENAHEAMAEREWQWFQWLLREKVRALAALTERSQSHE